MSHHPENSDDPQGASLIQRLHEDYGVELDAQVTLAPDSELSREPQDSAAPSTGTLKRLSSHTSPTTRYRVDGEIARGGMGAILEVWDEDLRRRLAMKVALNSKSGSSAGPASDLDPLVLARFLEEAQVTGQLDHPGIVPVHELGLDSNGQLFFTMRLVHGRDLEEIFSLATSEREGWTTTRALGVLLKACEAMAYAHSKGVIHRDLKPANLMVGKFGEVYVMDWGLARVAGHQERHDLRVAGPDELPVELDRREDTAGEASDALYTMDGDVLGTPAYMSPEQAQGELEFIDARSDVYSMGAMLYRLLTGAPPYMPDGKRKSPNALLNELLTGPPRAVEEFEGHAPDELVAICDKAMARDPKERYQGMLEFSEDLRAFLENRVVSAYETGVIAETRKWVRRNKPLAISMAAGVLALIGGLIASLVLKQMSDENAALAETRRVVADANADLAEKRRIEADKLARLAEERRIESDRHAEDARREARISKEVNDFLNRDLLAAVSPWNAGRTVTVREVLDVAAPNLDNRFPNDPLIEAELRLSMGLTYRSLGEFAEAASHLERARDLFIAEHGKRHLKSILAIGELGMNLTVLDQYEKAEPQLLEARELAAEILGPEHPHTLTAQQHIASLYGKQGRFEEQIALLQENLSIIRAAMPDDEEETLSTLNDLALAYQSLGRLDLAAQNLERTLDARKRINGPKHAETITAASNLAFVYEELGRYAEAEKLYEGLITVVEEVFGPNHPRTGRSLNNYGNLLSQLGRHQESLEYFERNLRVHSNAFGPDHHQTFLALNNLATCYSSLGNHEEALALRLEALPRLEASFGKKHVQYLSMCNNLGILYMDLRRYDDAIRVFEEVIPLYEEVHGPEHPDTFMVLENLSGIYYKLSNYEKCREILPIVLDGRIASLGDTHPSTIKTLFNMAMVEKSTGSREEAMILFEDIIDRYVESVGPDHFLVSDTLMQVAQMQLDAQEIDAARDTYLEALEIRRNLQAVSEHVGFYLHQIGYCHFAQSNWEESAKYLEESLGVRRQVFGRLGGNTLITMGTLCVVLRHAERFEEAEALTLDYNAATLEIGDRTSEHYQRSINCLRQLYEAWGKPEEAEKWANRK